MDTETGRNPTTAAGRLVVDMFMTLDQVMQAPGGPNEDRTGGFEHGGWQAPFASAESGAVIVEGVQRTDALLLGRRTYDIFAAHWPHVPGSNPIAAQFNRIPKYVASRTLTAPAWDNTTVLADVPRDVAEIKRRHAEVHLVGSADLLASLLAHDLVDELNLWLAPIVLGSGKRVFGDGTVPAAFELAAAPRPFPGGSVLLVYRRAGVPAYGDMSGGGSA